MSDNTNKCLKLIDYLRNNFKDNVLSSSVNFNYVNLTVKKKLLQTY